MAGNENLSSRVSGFAERIGIFTSCGPGQPSTQRLEYDFKELNFTLKVR